MTDLGILFLKLNDTELAYDKLHNVVTVDHGTTESLLALGAILQTKNDVEGALNTYKNIQNIQSEGFELWNNIGMCFYRKNKLIAVIMALDMSKGK
jgi:Bardet-Biedl syndrome 4 protein